jgi:hypothetical protein
MGKKELVWGEIGRKEGRKERRRGIMFQREFLKKRKRKTYGH